MRFIILQLLAVMTSAAVIDIGELYHQNSAKPIDETDSLVGKDIDGLYAYNSANPINYPERSKRSIDQSSGAYSRSRSLPVDIDQLYDQKSPIPTNGMAYSQLDDLDELYSYKNPSGINYPYAKKRTVRQAMDDQLKISQTPVAYNSVQEEVNEAINIDSIFRENLQRFIEQLKSHNIPGFSADQFFNDVMDFYHRRGVQLANVQSVHPVNVQDFQPAYGQRKPSFRRNVIDIGELYHQNGIPRNELPGSANNPAVDIDDLYLYNGNFPVYPQH